MKFKYLLAAPTILLIAGTSARAEQVAALIGDNSIAIIDTTARKVTKNMRITGIDGAVVGIDVRPADGMLYGLIDNGTVVTIDMSGKATMKSKLETMLAKGLTATVDFNPVADRLRVIGSDGTNLRVNVDDGKVTKDGPLKYADGDVNKGKSPRIVAGAYTNSVKGSKETALFDIDAATGVLVKQAPPNDGILNTVGMLGAKLDNIAFDIWSDGQGRNEAWAITGAELWRIDLATGKATPSARIEGVSGTVKDIAVLPAM
jgi:hypothetical protein